MLCCCFSPTHVLVGASGSPVPMFRHPGTVVRLMKDPRVDQGTQSKLLGIHSWRVNDESDRLLRLSGSPALWSVGVRTATDRFENVRLPIRCCYCLARLSESRCPTDYFPVNACSGHGGRQLTSWEWRQKFRWKSPRSYAAHAVQPKTRSARCALPWPTREGSAPNDD